MRFEQSDVATFRHAMLNRGQTLATLLSDVLAGKNPPALDSLLKERPGMRPEEVLRLALDQVDHRRVLLDKGDERFGRCERCGADIGVARLREMPWADRCEAHAAS